MTDMRRFHVKKGDEVVVIAGTERGKRGKIIEVQREKQRAIVQGIKMIKRHTRKTQQTAQGAIVEREGTVHIWKLVGHPKLNSNVLLSASWLSSGLPRSQARLSKSPKTWHDAQDASPLLEVASAS